MEGLTPKDLYKQSNIPDGRRIDNRTTRPGPALAILDQLLDQRILEPLLITLGTRINYRPKGSIGNVGPGRTITIEKDLFT